MSLWRQGNCRAAQQTQTLYTSVYVELSRRSGNHSFCACVCLSAWCDSAKHSVSPRRCLSHFTGCHEATGRARIKLVHIKSRCHTTHPAQNSCQSQQPHLKKSGGGGWFLECVWARGEPDVRVILTYQILTPSSGIRDFILRGIPNGEAGNLWGLMWKDWWVQVGVCG